jgi:hypothetical protein
LIKIDVKEIEEEICEMIENKVTIDTIIKNKSSCLQD